MYASQEKLATRGRFYNEDDLVDYDILDYDIDVASTPERAVDRRARARCGCKVRVDVLGKLTLRLADALVVQSIVSDEFGRLFGIAREEPEHVLVNLPAALARDTELTLTIAYSGRLEPQAPERETRSRRSRDSAPADRRRQMMLQVGAELPLQQPQLLVSAGAGHRLCDRAAFASPCPSGVECVASGELEPGSPTIVAREGSVAEPQACTCSPRRSRSAIWRSSSAASRAPKRDDRVRRDDARTDAPRAAAARPIAPGR